MGDRQGQGQRGKKRVQNYNSRKNSDPATASEEGKNTVGQMTPRGMKNTSMKQIDEGKITLDTDL